MALQARMDIPDALILKTKTRCILILLFLLSGCLFTGCSTVDTREVEVNLYTMPTTAPEKKFPLSAALVLDEDFKTYVIKREVSEVVPGVTETFADLIGPHIELYAKKVIADQFESVSIFDSVSQAVAKCDVIILPKAVRSSANMKPPIHVMVDIEWDVLDRSGKYLIWLTNVEAQSFVNPPGFVHGTARREVYTLVLSELSSKTIQAFQNSADIRALSAESEYRYEY